MFANIAPELLAFLRGEAPPTAFVILPAVPEFLVSPQITMALNIAVLLLTLESTGVIPAGWLCLCRQARRHRKENTRAQCQDFHFFILSFRGRPLVDCLVAFRTLLRVMLFLINVLTRHSLVLPQILSFVARQHAIRLVLALLCSDRPLFAAQILGFLPSQATIAYAVADAIALVVLARIHARVTRSAILPALALLSIVFFIEYVPAGPVLVAMQVGPLGSGQVAVRPIGALFLVDVALLALQAARLAARQFARTHSLADSLLLVLLTGIHARTVGTGVNRCGQPEGCHARQ